MLGGHAEVLGGMETLEPSYGTFTDKRSHIKNMEQHYKPYRLLDSWKSLKQVRELLAENN